MTVSAARPSAFAARLRDRLQPALILDGASGTELERIGAHFSSALWSAQLLADDPEMILDMHKGYLAASAQVIESVSYQASVAGFRAEGYSRRHAEELIARSWRLAQRAVTMHQRDSGRRVFAASAIGPYGAFCADGSEYTGAYRLSSSDLAQFHGERIALLYNAGCRLFAVETIPRLDEAMVLARIMRDYPDADWWLSFSLARPHPDDEARTPLRIADGTALGSVLAQFARQDNPPLAVGVNCCHVAAALPAIQQIFASGLIPLAYPNTGGDYDAASGRWSPASTVFSGADCVLGDAGFAAQAAQWAQAGARLVGGCCQTTPATTKAIVSALSSGQ